MDQLEKVLQQIRQRQQFLLTSHARPDGDAIGSVLALSEVLRKMGKSAEVVLSDNVRVIYKPLPFADTIVHSSHVNGKYEAAIILECDSVQRTRLQGLERHFLISIDHHATSRTFADVNWIDPSASATAEMVFRLAVSAGVRITPEIADDRIRVSVRSKGAVNVAQFAEMFGGGGHECASGFSVQGPFPEAAKRVLTMLRERLPHTS